MDPSASATPNAVASSRTRAKANVAIAAGAALLLGGGTLAYWSTQQVIATGTINSGDLNLVAGTGTWTLQGVAQTAPTPVTDITTVKLVPGDVLTLTQPGARAHSCATRGADATRHPRKLRQKRELRHPRKLRQTRELRQTKEPRGPRPRGSERISGDHLPPRRSRSCVRASSRRRSASSSVRRSFT